MADDNLHSQHQAIIAARAISPEVSQERSYESVDAVRARKLGFTGDAQNLAGLLIPIHSVNGKLEGYQLRPDKPALDRNGKPKKYVFPPKRKQRAMLDVLPRHHSKLSDPKIPLLITESILKADSATSGWGDQLCVIGESGVNGFRGTNAQGGKTALACWQTIALNGRSVFLVPDSDVSTNPAVFAAVQRQQAFLASKGAIVHVIKLPHKLNGEKQGLDDWRAVNPNATLDGLVRLINDDLKAPDDLAKDYPTIKAEIDDKFAYIKNDNQVYEVETKKLITPHIFKEGAAAPLRYIGTDGKPASGAEAWLKDRSRRTHQAITFAPGQPRITERNDLNLWEQPDIEPIEGDVSDYLGLLDHVFENEPDLRTYFLQWAAWPLVHLDDPKMFVAVILWSNTHGAGKDLVGFPLGALYGPHARLIARDDLHDSFNGFLANALWIHASEVCSLDRKADAQKLKFMVTMPRVLINEKYKPKVDHPNFANLYSSSNYCDAAFIDPGERRYFVHHATERVFDPELGARIYKKYRTPEGKSALLWYLLNKVDLATFNPNSPALHTDALREMQEAGLPDLDRYARDVIEGLIEKFAKSDIWRLEELADLAPESRDGGTLKRLGKSLSNMGAANLGVVRVGREQVRLWAIRNAVTWRKAPGPQIAEAFKLRDNPPLKFDKGYRGAA